MITEAGMLPEMEWRLMSARKCALYLMLLLALCICDMGFADGVAFGVVDNSDRVHLRAQPSVQAAWVGSYARGEWVEIFGERDDWYSVMGSDGRSGYMSKNYVTVVQDSYGTIGLVSNPNETSFLNLRSKPSYTASVLGIYYNEVPCILLSLSDGWYRVRVNGTEGYFRSEFITQSYQVFSEEVATIVTPNNTALNMRQGPGKQYDVVRQYHGGDYVMVLQRGNGWWKVSAGGDVGFMSTEFLVDGILTPSGQPSEQKKSDAVPAVTALPKLQDGKTYAIVNNPKPTQVLNLRQTPDLNGEILGQYSNGVEFEVLAYGEEWSHVKSKEQVEGYMMTAFLAMYTAPATPVMTVQHPQQSYVNLREEASISSDVLMQVPHGTQVTVLIPGDTWVKVRYEELTGYMVASFLE